MRFIVIDVKEKVSLKPHSEDLVPFAKVHIFPLCFKGIDIMWIHVKLNNTRLSMENTVM